MTLVGSIGGQSIVTRIGFRTLAATRPQRIRFQRSGSATTGRFIARTMERWRGRGLRLRAHHHEARKESASWRGTEFHRSERVIQVLESAYAGRCLARREEAT